MEVKEAWDIIAGLNIELVEQYSEHKYNRWRLAVHTMQKFLQPILDEQKPLTSELLEKKGFERVPQPKCVNPYHWMLEKYEEESEGLLYRIRAYNTPFRGMYVRIDNHAYCEPIVFGGQIEHVHELQQAFRLCNIDINL